MNENTKKWIWISTGAITLGVGGFFLFKAIRDKFFKSGLDNSNEGQNQNSSNGQSSLPNVPFQNTTEGNAFRSWVNDNYPEYAREIDLDRTGSYNNSYIKKAWAKYGAEYQSLGSVSSGNQSSSWGKDALALSELKDRLVYDHNQDVDWIGSTKIEWDVTNAYPTVFFQAYPGGLLVLEKKKTLLGSRYQKQTGTWEKTPSGNWRFTFGGKTYDTPTGQQLINTLWGLMKDANYFSWSDGSFVPFTHDKSINKDWQSPLL